jgi:hypothetical protein
MSWRGHIRCHDNNDVEYANCVLFIHLSRIYEHFTLKLLVNNQLVIHYFPQNTTLVFLRLSRCCWWRCHLRRFLEMEVLKILVGFIFTFNMRIYEGPIELFNNAYHIPMPTESPTNGRSNDKKSASYKHIVLTNFCIGKSFQHRQRFRTLR